MEEKFHKVNEHLKVNQCQEELKVKNIIQRFNQTGKFIQEYKQHKERDLMLKSEQATMNRTTKELFLRRKSNVDEYKREINLFKLKIKLKKSDDFKDHKQNLLERRKKIAEETNNKKMEIINKFEKLSKKSSGVNVRLVKINLL